jgi:hypothetical protein
MRVSANDCEKTPLKITNKKYTYNALTLESHSIKEKVMIELATKLAIKGIQRERFKDDYEK